MALETKSGMNADYYVYELIDPRDGSVFYVGKGKGNRIASHEAMARKGRIDNPAKYARIREIWDAGLEVERRYVRRGLTETEAFALERQMIDAVDGLTNIVGGCRSKEEVVRDRGKAMLAQLKPYSVWLATRPFCGDGAVKQLGGPKLFYAWFKSMLEDMAGIDDREVVVLK